LHAPGCFTATRQVVIFFSGSSRIGEGRERAKARGVKPGRKSKLTSHQQRRRQQQLAATVVRILRDAGRATTRGDHKSARGVRARIERVQARTAPMIEQAAAMEAAGASRAEIGEAVGLSPSGAHMLLKRARQDGRLPASGLRHRQQAVTLVRETTAAALADAGKTRAEIAAEFGIAVTSVGRQAGPYGRSRRRDSDMASGSSDRPAPRGGAWEAPHRSVGLTTARRLSR